MKTSSLDILENARLPPEQARAILQVMEVELSDRYDLLATRTDLAQAEQRIRSELSSEIRAEFRLLRSEIATEVAGLKTEIKSLKADMGGLQVGCQELRADHHALEARLAHRFNALLVSVTGIFAIFITLYSGVMAFIFNCLRAR